MTFEMNRIEVDNLQLIDFSEEDDFLIEFPFRDTLEDLRLSVTFDNVNEYDRNKLFGGVNSHVQSESVEPRRPSFLRKSLAWDNAFFTSAGVLDPEELFTINKGFKRSETNQPSSGTRKEAQLHLVSGQDPTKSNSKISKVATSIAGKKMTICPQSKVKPVQASMTQSLILQGPKSAAKTRITEPQIKQEKVSSLRKLISSTQTKNAAAEGSESAKMENKTRKAGTVSDMTRSKRFRSGDLSGLPKSTSFTSPITEKKSKIRPLYESFSSSSSSKNISKSVRSKNNPRKTKPINSPSSVHFPLSSTCSSSTSPASSIDEWFSESLSSTTTTVKDQNTIPAPDFKSQNSEERRFNCQISTRSSIGSSPFSGGPNRKVKSSGLRMPSPKIGFFDEDPVFQGSMLDHFVIQSPLTNENKLNKFQASTHSPSVSTDNCLKFRKIHSRENDGRKLVASCSKLKSDRKIHKEISKNRMNKEPKRLKDDTCSFHMIGIKKKQDESDQCDLHDSQKENVCSFEAQVNGLSRQLEVIDLDRDVAEVKGQRSCVKQVGQISLPLTAEHTTPSRTPLAEKVLSK